MTEEKSCPDCGSADVSYFRYNSHPYYCWDCGIRFDQPNYVYEQET